MRPLNQFGFCMALAYTHKWTTAAPNPSVIVAELDLGHAPPFRPILLLALD
jgi:hypothetical protein